MELDELDRYVVEHTQLASVGTALIGLGLYVCAAVTWLVVSQPLITLLVPGVTDQHLGIVRDAVLVVATAALLYSLILRSSRHEHGLRAIAIVASSDDAIITKSLQGVITSWNPAARRMFGYSAAEAVGCSIEMLIPADRPDEEAWILGKINAGERFEQFETVRVRKDGTLIEVSITFSPTWQPDATAPGGRRIVGVSKIARDITKRRTAEALAAKEQRFARSLIEAMPGVFYLHSQQGRFLRWNRNLETLSGYSGAELAEIHPLALFADADRQLMEQRIAETFETGASSMEAAFVSKDRTATPYYFTGKRITFDDATCFGGVGLDIAERKRAETSLRKNEERFRTTLDNMLEGCQLIDFDWRYLFLNGAAAAQNRRPNAELLGNSMREVWPGIESTPLFALLDRCMRNRVHVNAETEFTFADGSKGWFDVRAQPVREGIFVLSIDISERKHAERELHELNESLELRVQERTVDLDAAREHAEAADRLKSVFLATMSHELRTPLNSILGFTGMILQELAGPLNPEQAKQLGMVMVSARHLLALINDILDLSKIEAGQLDVSVAPFDLRASLDRLVASVEPLARQKRLAIDLIAPATIVLMESDQRRVEQIILNLLNNGIKFTERGHVTLSLEIRDTGAVPMARIAVSDSGIGIKHEDLGILFQPFRQLDTGLHRQHEGSGLGLAICRRLTSLLHGTIGAESVWGQGSTFWVSLPMKKHVDS